MSSAGSTQSYIYVGFHIKPVEGAVKLKSTCDAVNNTMDSAEITSDIDNVQCWYPIANYDNGAYSLFGSGRVYDALFEWHDEEQAVTFEKITLTLKGGNKEIFDEENGMGAIFAESPIFLPNYRLEIKDITDTHMDSLADKLKVNESLTQLFDINVKNSLGEIVDFGNSDSSYDVYIRLDDEFDLTAKYVVIYVDDTGEVAERIEARIVNGNEGANYLVFTANHLSKYGIVKVTESEEPTVDVKNPNTSDKFSFFASALTVSSLVLAGVYLYTKRV